jgi:hypothetical protein
MYNTENDPRFDVRRVSGEDLILSGYLDDHKDNSIIPSMEYVLVVRKTTDAENIVPLTEYKDHVILRFWVESQYHGGLLDFCIQGITCGEYESVEEILKKTDDVLSLFVEREWWNEAASFRDQINETKKFYNVK